METKLVCLFIAGALLVAQSGVALAQSPGWSVVQAVPVDERLIVKQKNGKTITGRMIEASETNLALSRDRKVVNISRDNIAQIERSIGKAAKTKWALIGAGAGAATGAAIGQSKVEPNAEIWLPVGIIFGTGIGAAVGALFGATRRKREVIYTAP